MFRLGYNTNGFAHHRPADALRMISSLGYEAVAITPDVGPLDPLDPDHRTVEALAALADELGLERCLETGARFVLDPRRKHFPSLLEDSAAERARRQDFLRASLNLAADLGAGVINLWAGRAPGGHTADEAGGDEVRALVARLAEGLRPVLDRAGELGLQVGFEPEPGMFIERPRGYSRLLEALGPHADGLGLTLDVGHCVCTGDVPVESAIREWSSRLVAVQLDDMRPGEHVHRMFGEGRLDLGATLQALREVGFEGVAAVELSRESHRAPQAAAEAMAHLRSALGVAESDPRSGPW